MYPKNELIRLFEQAGCKKPSVIQFKKLLSPMPAAQQAYYRAYAFRLGMHEWKNLNKRYQRFLINLIRHDQQAFADFMLQDTLLGAIRYRLRDPDFFLKMINLQERYEKDYNNSYDFLSLALLLGFDYRYKISTLGDKIAAAVPQTTDLWPSYVKVQLMNTIAEKPTDCAGE